MRGTKPLLLIGALGCALLLTSLVATAADSTPKTGKELPDLSWLPPEDGFDWIQLKSGEWLKGEFKGMQERRLDFDSSELDIQQFEWEKIRQVRTAGEVEIRLVDGEIFSGRVLITPTEVRTLDSSGHVWPREQLQSLTRVGKNERSYWSGDVSAGLTLRGGTVTETDFNGDMHLQRRTAQTRTSLDYTANYSKARDVVNDDNWRLSVRLDKFLTDRFYIVLPGAEYFSDPMQNIGDRTTVGAGVAYDLAQNSKLEWTVIGGPAYQWLRYTSPPVGEPDRREGVALGISSRLEWDITKDIEWATEYKGQFASKSSGSTTHHVSTKLSIDLTKRLDLDVSLIWDRTVNFPLTSTGAEPPADDYRMVVALAFEF
jgi:hypothetical protein